MRFRSEFRAGDHSVNGELLQVMASQLHQLIDFDHGRHIIAGQRHLDDVTQKEARRGFPSGRVRLTLVAVSFPFGFPGHNPATHTPDGTPIGAIYAAQARQQPYYLPTPMSAAEVALRDAVKREGAVCQLGEQPCGVAAVSRCYECSRTFCLRHRSFARPGSVATMRLEYFDWCQPCQNRHVEQAEAQAAREREAAELREQEAVREHAAAVAAHEKASGWDPRRAAELDRLIGSSYSSYRKPERMGLAVVLGVVAFAALAFIVYAVMVAPHMGAGDLVALVVCSAPLLAMLAWSISRYGALVAWQHHQGWIFEREGLRELGGCGVAGCQRC